jgi:hypothetical protein
MMPLLVSPTAKQGIRHQPIGSMMQVSWNRSSSSPHPNSFAFRTAKLCRMSLLAQRACREFFLQRQKTNTVVLAGHDSANRVL